MTATPEPARTEEIRQNLADAADDAPRPWAKLAAIGSIAVLLVSALFWLFSVDARATYAKEKVDAHDKVLENKAEKSEVKDGFDQLNKRLDTLTDFLINNRKR